MKKQSNTEKVRTPSQEKEMQDEDIIKVLKAEHEPLKKLIKIMKDTEKSQSERSKAFDEFAPLLIVHAKAEERVLYEFLKNEVDMPEEGYEGDVEHGLAEQMLDEAKSEDDDHVWSAKVKILAELVEHHIEEEEGEIFAEFKKKCELEMRKELTALYLAEKSNVQRDEKDSAKETAREIPISAPH